MLEGDFALVYTNLESNFSTKPRLFGFAPYDQLSPICVHIFHSRLDRSYSPTASSPASSMDNRKVRRTTINIKL
jgi:hypothetical protein